MCFMSSMSVHLWDIDVFWFRFSMKKKKVMLKHITVFIKYGIKILAIAEHMTEINPFP